MRPIRNRGDPDTGEGNSRAHGGTRAPPDTEDEEDDEAWLEIQEF
jgi:hypothetical protein